MKYPVILFFITVLLNACSSNKEEKKQEENKPTAPKYQLATVEKGGVASAVKLPAQLAAYQEVSIFPKVNAYVKTVSVDIGSRTAQGDVLMTLEAPELDQAVAQAREKYAKAGADFSIDKERFNRLFDASRTAGAVSPLELSTVRAKIEADSAVWNAEKVNWQMQQTMLGYLKVTAPFSGVITERNVHPGALVSAAVRDKPMLELKQIDRLRLQADIPEGLAANLKNKDTVSFYVSAVPGKRLTGFIARKSMNVSPQFRNERMEVDVPNPDGRLSAGMYADITLYSKGNPDALYAPKSAVVTSTERKYVMAVRNHKTVKVDVRTGASSADKVEIYGALQAGDQVIANANDEIAEGIEIL